MLPNCNWFIGSSSKRDGDYVALAARGFAPRTDRADVYAFEDWWRPIEELIVKADTGGRTTLVAGPPKLGNWVRTGFGAV